MAKSNGKAAVVSYFEAAMTKENRQTEIKASSSKAVRELHKRGAHSDIISPLTYFMA